MGAKFKKFWKETEGVEALAQAKGWEKAVRGFIAGVVSSTYRSIRSEQLIDLLNLPAGELNGLIKERGWSRSKEDKEVVIVNTEKFESEKPKEIKKSQPTNMSLEQYRKLFLAATS